MFVFSHLTGVLITEDTEEDPAMAKNQSTKHALIVPLPFQGHINPLLELSKKLISAGFMVTFANTQVNHQRIIRFLGHRANSIQDDEVNHSSDVDLLLTKKELGIFQQKIHVVEQIQEEDGYGDQLHNQSRIEEKEGVCLRLVSLEDGLPAQFGHWAYRLQDCISAPVKASVERLVSRLLQEECPVSCLVSDLRLLFMQDIASKHALPRLAFWTQSAASFISNLLLARGFQAPPDDSTLITCMPGVPPHKRSEVSVLALDGVRFPSLSDEYVWQPFKRISESEWVMINTFEQLELTTLDALQEMLGYRPLTVGPLVGASVFSILEGIPGLGGGGQADTSDDSYYMKWLQGRPPASILYIAFGTVATFSEMQLEELVFGLEATQQPFVWVFRPDLCKELDSNRVGALIRRLQNQGIVVPWAPQWRILCHPAVGGFLTHCGWNSTLEGIAAGVPMLGWPHLGDQFVNQRCIESVWGVGLSLVRDEKSGGLVIRAEVEEKVLALMQGDTAMHLKERALALKGAAQGALAGGSSALNIESFCCGL